MGQEVSSRRWLWQPGDDLKWPAELEEKFCKEILDAVFLNVFGRFAMSTQSWASISQSVDKDQLRLVRELQKALDKESSITLAVTEVQMIVLKGQMNPPEPRSAWTSWLPDITSRVSVHLGPTGNVKSTTKVNVNDSLHIAHRNPPSDAQLGLQETLDKEKDQDAAQGNAYMLKLDQTYCFTHYNPPRGRESWESDLVLLRVCVGQKTFLVLQLDATEPTADGLSKITARNLAGEELAVVQCHLHNTSVADMATILAKQLGTPEEKLRLAFPNGVVADEMAGSALIESHFDFGRGISSG